MSWGEKQKKLFGAKASKTWHPFKAFWQRQVACSSRQRQGKQGKGDDRFDVAGAIHWCRPRMKKYENQIKHSLSFLHMFTCVAF